MFPFDKINLVYRLEGGGLPRSEYFHVEASFNAETQRYIVVEL